MMSVRVDIPNLVITGTQPREHRQLIEQLHQSCFIKKSKN